MILIAVLILGSLVPAAAVSSLTAMDSLVAGKTSSVTAIRNCTVIDVSQAGSATDDIPDAVVVISGDKISAVGPADRITIPAGAEIVDGGGGYLVPGLIDGFAALNHQAHANAYLYSGVTSILGVESTRRGPLDLDSDPSPHVYRLGEVGYEPAPLPDLLADLEAQHEHGMNVVLLMYRIEPEQMGPLVARAQELGLATIGELARTTYARAAASGVDAFVHTSRYSLDLAPDELRRGVAEEPFSNDLASAKWQYYKLLTSLAADSARTMAHGRRMAEGGAALMPTFSLGYLDRPGHANPWREPVAAIIDPRDIHWPADQETGEHTYPQAETEAYRDLALVELALDRAYFRAGCGYLAGSGTDVWGTMPGISLHHELEALSDIGHTPRQALAAATSNFAAAFGWREVSEVAAGRRADLLLLGSDPRLDVHNLLDISDIWLAGRRLNRSRLLEPVPLADGQLVEREEMDIPADFLDEDGALREEFAYLNRVRMAEITYISDTLRVAGHLVVPAEPGSYPCVIYNRGGNREFGANSPRRVMRRLARYASWGYVVVASQYRGNAGGEGQEEFGGIDVNDVLNLIPLLESLNDRADPSRIGMVGFSRGGLMTYLALARSDRMAAAVVGAGVADSFFGIEERPEMEEYVYSELIPGYWENKEAVLAARSPILWPEKLCKTTPILLLHGSADWRVNPTEGLRMARALYDCRHPFRFVFFEGGDHGLTEHRTEMNRLTRDWLDRYVRDREAWPSLEPHGD
jgi:dienelactone hydrolase